MSSLPHDLAADFPGAQERIHALRSRDPHFARIVEDYAVLNRQVWRAETRLDTLDGFAEQTLRKRRATLKDEISRLLAET